MTTVGVAIPTIPPRATLLARALDSVLAQHRPADAISIAVDLDHQGAAATRNRAWRGLQTDWVAFVDDDDEIDPAHLGWLLECALDNDADLVYPWFRVEGGTDPFPQNFGRPWNPADPVQTTITVLWRREALEAIGGFPHKIAGEPDADGNRAGEDYVAVLNLNKVGGRIVHLPERTWTYHHHASNTSGRPDRWR